MKIQQDDDATSMPQFSSAAGKWIIVTSGDEAPPTHPTRQMPKLKSTQDTGVQRNR